MDSLYCEQLGGPSPEGKKTENPAIRKGNLPALLHGEGRGADAKERSPGSGVRKEAPDSLQALDFPR